MNALCFFVFSVSLLCTVAQTRQYIDNAQDLGAVCLDGTPAGYYLKTGSETDKWQIYFEGGGWCYSEQDCFGRSSTNLGSSSRWPDAEGAGGLLDANCDVNPTFCNWNLVYIKYCDGNSFSGNRDDPVVVNGKPLYFRGRRIIDAVLADITTKHDFGSAQEVLLTGCSAGGLSTYLHVDYVGSQLPASVHKYRAAPISGFFLDHLNVDGIPVYGNQMKNIFQLANSTNGLNDACIAAKAVDDQWQCNMAPHVLPYIQSPIFVLNSMYDSWQSGCILSAEPVVNDKPGTNGNCSAAEGWAACSYSPEHCNAQQIGDYNEFGQSLEQLVKGALKKTDGAWLTSCHTHCEAQDSNAYTKFKIQGVSMSDAVGKWWADDNPSGFVIYRDCSYNVDKHPHMCNPTCN